MPVPFEKPVPAGFHDPSDDSFDKDALVRQHEKRRDQVEAEERKKDKKKIAKRRADDNPESIFAQKQEHKRSKLVLPEPQVSDRELEDIVKIGQASDSIRELADEHATTTLLTDYNKAFEQAQAARTLRTPAAQSDAVAKAADDLLALTNTETPLKGGVNAPLHSTDFRAPSSVRGAIQTPNTVLAAIGQTPRTIYDQTPGTAVSQTPGPTPFRDQLNINKDADRMSKAELQRQLQSLPAPSNDFEIVLPEEKEEEDEDMDMDFVEDAAEIDSRRAAIREKKRQEQLALRTEVFRRGLPMPSKLNDAFFKRIVSKNEFDEADNLIRAEMRTLLKWDVDGIEPSETFTPEELKAASDLVDSTGEKYGGFDEHEYMSRAIALTSGTVVNLDGRFVQLEDVPRKDRKRVLRAEGETLLNDVKQIETENEKAENEPNIELQDFEKVEEKNIADLLPVQRKTDLETADSATFLELQIHAAAEQRIPNLLDVVEKARQRYAELQKEYSEVSHRQWEMNQEVLRH